MLKTSNCLAQPKTLGNIHPKERFNSGPTGRLMRLMLAAASCAALGGCAADQVYESVRNAQRVQCHRLADPLLRQRCLDDANLSHGKYQQQTAPFQRTAPGHSATHQPTPSPVAQPDQPPAD